jgi:hypothetical protein
MSHYVPRMRTVAAALILVATLGPALAEATTDQDATREQIYSAIADAGAHAALCPDPSLITDNSVMLLLLLKAHFVKSEMQGIVDQMHQATDELRGTATDVICRDAIERYGADGDIVKGLLVPK